MNISDWKMADSDGESRFLLYQVGEDHLLHYKGSLSQVGEIQRFVRDHPLTQTFATCPDPTATRTGMHNDQQPL